MPLVKLFAGLRKAAGLKEVTVDGANIGEVVAALVRKHPALAPRLLDGGQIRAHVVITINGHATQDMLAATKEDDEVAFFPPIAGG